MKFFLLFVSFPCLVLGLVLFSSPAFAATSSSSIIPNDLYWGKQWDLPVIHAPEAWGMTTGSRDVVVAVLDSGVDIDHPDLKENIWTNTREIPNDGIDNDQDGFVDDVYGWNFLENTSDTRPTPGRRVIEEAWSHGTFIASLIGAKGNNKIGMAGVAWNVQIMPMVVLDGEGYGNVPTVVEAIKYAVAHGASIINLSFSGYEYDPALDQAVKDAADAGVLVVSATGNDESTEDGLDLDDRPMFPACLDNRLIGVLGVTGLDKANQKAPFANFGRSCTDLSAPSEDFFGARPTFPSSTSTVATTTPQYLQGLTGTSLSAPLVSGAAALLKSWRPELSLKQLHQALFEGADMIEDGFPENQQGSMGAGRLNIARSLEIATVMTRPEPPRVSAWMADKALSFFYQYKDTLQSWILPGTTIAHGWLADDAMNTNARAYAATVKKATATVSFWRPGKGAVQTASLPLRGTGPWKSDIVRTVSSTRLVFTSTHSTYQSWWDLDTWKGGTERVTKKKK